MPSGSDSGTLYRVDADLSWTAIDGGYRVTNGPAFSPDGKLMYHNDSRAAADLCFDLDCGRQAAERRIFLQFNEGEGYPDGMTVDRDGCLWIALWDGWCVRRYSPAGEWLETVRMPVARPTSCAFGGPDFDRLYITSASIGLDEERPRDATKCRRVIYDHARCTGAGRCPLCGLTRTRPSGD